LSRVAAVHTRSVKSKAWEAFDVAAAKILTLPPTPSEEQIIDNLAIEIGGALYASEQFKGEHNANGYFCAPLRQLEEGAPIAPSPWD
jgi:hypothetical protein